MKKPRTRKERIEFIARKKGKRGAEFFIYMTDREVKNYFDLIYPAIKDILDAHPDDDTAQCLRCGWNVEYKIECACGINRCVFSEEEWKEDIEHGNFSEMRESDKEFIKNDYQTLG